MPAAGNRLGANGSLNNRGSTGNYWSSTESSSTNANNLNFNSSSVTVNSNNNRTNGFSVRCVAALSYRCLFDEIELLCKD
ncbi:fibrobacter succinogenes major paralogous domain-containing protein [Elizabethkingia anophelis]|uniref:fibrobacter succinogenes major paralogous domain-containing protein n=1 Tax=Elizabethkingia anophelis TaxID=1117645 RepID=UPI002011640F|nr:fibrobacter succinogenes major paralogous domain-containing protein [Elizabethkingia anophelis]MCL1689401.1 fibrobacter succinogenes major paralogous domain-containing protein [Elizabethkingia anophelis]